MLTPWTRVLDFPDFLALPALRCEPGVFHITKSGHVHAIIYWWSCDLNKSGASERRIRMSTACGASPAPDHWRQNVKPLSDPLRVSLHDTVPYDAFHNEDDIWFELKPTHMTRTKPCNSQEKSLNYQQDDRGQEQPSVACPPICNCGLHALLPRLGSPVSLVALNDPYRRSAFRLGIQSMMEGQTTNDWLNTREDHATTEAVTSWCLVLGDSFFAPLICAEAGYFERVITASACWSHDEQENKGRPSFYTLARAIVHTNGFGQMVDFVSLADCQDLTDADEVVAALGYRIDMAQCHFVVIDPFVAALCAPLLLADSLTSDGLSADGQSGACEGWGLMTMLFIYTLVLRLLDTTPPHLHHERRLRILPTRAVVFGALFRSKHLRAMLAPVDNCQGIDMRAANQLRVVMRSDTGEVDAGLHAAPLVLNQWQDGSYNGLTQVTEAVTLLELDWLTDYREEDDTVGMTSDPGEEATPKKGATSSSYARCVPLHIHPSFCTESSSSLRACGHEDKEVKAEEDCIADVLVLWVDYDLSTLRGVDTNTWLKAGVETPYARQGVIGLEEPLLLSEYCLSTQDGASSRRTRRKGSSAYSCFAIGQKLSLALSARLESNGQFMVSIQNREVV